MYKNEVTDIQSITPNLKKYINYSCMNGIDLLDTFVNSLKDGPTIGLGENVEVTKEKPCDVLAGDSANGTSIDGWFAVEAVLVRQLNHGGVYRFLTVHAPIPVDGNRTPLSRPQ